MLLPVLLLLLVCGSQAAHYYGTVMTYYPKEIDNGSLLVTARYKLSFVACTDNDTWSCSGNCGNETAGVELNVVDENIGEWCQREGIMTRLVPGNAPFELVLDGETWITGIINSIVSSRAVTDVELSFRSDSDQINTSPLTTILPALRVPSNCPRNISLLAYDPDGDEVKCRNGITSDSECNPCTPPSVLSLSSTCTLSFSPTNSSNEGPYAVQLVMEDFPRQNIDLIRLDGSLVQKTTSEAISKIPVQFVLKVDPAVPSCTEGIYLPRFLSPTPQHGAQILTTVNQTVVINIAAETTQSTISGLLFSGPHNMVRSSQGSGNFTLTWTPSSFENGESHPICFVVQSSLSSSVYQSGLRCVIVKVGNHSVPKLNTRIVTTANTTPPVTTQSPTTTETTTAFPTPTTTVISTVTPVVPPIVTQTTAAPFPTTTAATTTPFPTTTTPPFPTTTTPFPTTTTTVVSTVTPIVPPIVTQTTAATTTPFPTTTTPPFPTTTAATTTPFPTTTTPPFPTTTTTTTTTTPFPTTTTPFPTTTTTVVSTVTPIVPPIVTQTTAATTTPFPTTTTTPFPTTTAATTTPFPTTTTTPFPTTTTTVVPSTVSPIMPPTVTPTTATTTLPPPTTTASNSEQYYVIALNAKISTTLSLEDDYATIIQLLKQELINNGLPADLILSIQSNVTAAPRRPNIRT